MSARNLTMCSQRLQVFSFFLYKFILWDAPKWAENRHRWSRRKGTSVNRQYRTSCFSAWDCNFLRQELCVITGGFFFFFWMKWKWGSLWWGGDLSHFLLSLRTFQPVVLHLPLWFCIGSLEDQERLFSYIFHPLILNHIYSVSTGFEGFKNFLIFRQDNSMVLSLEQYIFFVRTYSAAGILLPTYVVMCNENVYFSKVNMSW